MSPTDLNVTINIIHRGLLMYQCLPGCIILLMNLCNISADDSDDGIGMCGWILTAISWAMVLATLPFSLCVCFKVRLYTFKNF